MDGEHDDTHLPVDDLTPEQLKVWRAQREREELGDPAEVDPDGPQLIAGIDPNDPRFTPAFSPPAPPPPPAFENVATLIAKGWHVNVAHHRTFIPGPLRVKSSLIPDDSPKHYSRELIKTLLEEIPHQKNIWGEYPCIHNPRGGHTIVHLLNADKTKLWEGKSWCNPCDVFSKKVGLMIALARVLFFSGFYTEAQARDMEATAFWMADQFAKKRPDLPSNLGLSANPNNTPIGTPSSQEYAELTNTTTAAPEIFTESLPFALVCQLAQSLGFANLNQQPGTWEHFFGPWHVALNPHNLPTRSTRGTPIEAFQCAIEHEGKMAGWVGLKKHTVSAGKRDQQEEFCEDIKAEIKRIIAANPLPPPPAFVPEAGYF